MPRRPSFPSVILGLSPATTAYVWALGVVLATFLMRLGLRPFLHEGSAYAFSYLAVVLTSYALGRGPGAFATLGAAVLGFYCFSAPQFSWKADAAHITSLGFFLLNSAVVVYVVSGLTRALAELSAERGRAQAVANSHADLFCELNQRISHHLRLVAGVLTLQAKGEPEADVLRGLKSASERSVTLARVHRQMAGGGDAPVDFGAFASGLVRSVCHAHDLPLSQVVLEPSEVWLPQESATSLGVALVECVGALLARKDCARLRIAILAGAVETRVAISELDETTGVAMTSLSSGYLLRAMVEQLGAEVSLRADGQGSALELVVPHIAAFPPAAAMTAPQVGTVH